MFQLTDFQAISKFESMVNQIHKNAQDIEQRLEMIENTNLFKPCPLNQLGELPRCKVTCHSVRLVNYHSVISRVSRF
jgi:hypothetical protein